MLPFGAFVKPKGEFEYPSENSLRSAPAWKQILVLLAGPGMNFLTAVVLFTICVHQVGAPEPSIVILDKKRRLIRIWRTESDEDRCLFAYFPASHRRGRMWCCLFLRTPPDLPLWELAERYRLSWI